MKIIEISYYLYEKCKEFAETRIKDSEDHYRYRGESNRDKMIEDIIVGTMGEYAVYKYLLHKGYECSKPDLTIHKTRNKSFGADLKTPEFNIHVKSQSSKSIDKYGRSWLFQKSDKLVKNPDSEDVIAMTSVDLKTRKVQVLGFLSPLQIAKAGGWGECKVEWYRKTKVAIYLDDLEKKGLIVSKL